MPRCWPSFRSRSKKEAGGSTKSGKLPDGGSSASTFGSDAKTKTQHDDKETKDDKKDEKSDEKNEGDEAKDEEEKEKPKIVVGSFSEAKNIYRGATDNDGNWTWVDKYPDGVEE